MGREFRIPNKVFTGEGALLTAESTIKSCGKKALIVTGGHVSKLDCFKNLTDLLDEIKIEYAVFSGITGEPDDKMINSGVSVFKAEKCDFLIAIGGGSPLDSMKAIAALSVLGGEISDYMGKLIESDMPKMIAIPTTAGTGSEVTKFTIITDSHKNIKMLLKGDCLVPDIAIVDGAFSQSSPSTVTAATGLDALTHAIECYTSRLAQPLTDSVSIAAVKRIFKYLPTAFADGTNKQARDQMAIAALEAGIAINNGSVTIVHGMSRPIGALFHCPHGMSNAILLEKCLSFAYDGAIDKFAELARAIGAVSPYDNDEIAAEAFINAVGDLCRQCKIPTLAQFGVDKDVFYNSIDKMTDDAIASGSPANTLKNVTREDVVSIYRSLYE